MTYKEFHELDSLEKSFDLKIVTPADSFFVFYNNCKLSKDRNKEREKGNNIVFHYYYKNTDYAWMIDENYFEKIQFEITPELLNDTITTRNLKEVNLIYNWGCFCDSPDSIEAKENIGGLELIKKNDSIWIVKLNVDNFWFNNKKLIEKEFVLYKPEFEISKWDTINRFDNYRRKQGHWITEDYYTITNGVYKDNYFTGSKFRFMYYKNKKTLREISIYKNNKWIQDINFDEYGQIKE